jgi:hypothetical protein
MKITEKDLLALMTIDEAMAYHQLCSKEDRHTAGSGKTVFENMIVDVSREGLAEALVGRSFWCLVLVHPVWTDPDVVKSAWNRIRSRFLGDTILDGMPTPKLILALP